jgi:hypothetical protein
MDGGEFEDERETLNGIASVLLSLAVLAEFLCVLPLSLRVAVLMLLRPAEAVARAFAVERTGGGLALPPVAVPGTDGDGCAEAMRLARCFRVLASIIGGSQGFAVGRRLFRDGPGERLADPAPAVAWQGRTMNGRHATALCTTGRFDTS